MRSALASAQATPYLVVDADSGQVLIDNEATAVWYPASLTKLMTVYVALDAVRNGRLTLDTPLIMSLRAARMAPSKMGFRPGTEVTLDNALKMLMVKSPNDVAVMVAEGISGSVEAFADEMNADAQRLGLHESHFVNPNGLHDPGHVSSARDMAMIARALLREFPDHADLFSIGALQLGNQYIANHNGLLGRYPGADGMKTGFTCPAGFNVVASANHGGRRLIVVVLGSPSTRLRNQEAADLFDRGFAMGAGSESLDSLPPGSGAPDPRANICLHRSAAMLAAAEEAGLAAPAQAAGPGRGVPLNPNPLAALLAQARSCAPYSPTQGPISIRCASLSAQRRDGRVPCSAPGRWARRDSRGCAGRREGLSGGSARRARQRSRRRRREPVGGGAGRREGAIRGKGQTKARPPRCFAYQGSESVGREIRQSQGR